MTGILRSLGVIGWEGLEDYCLAALVTGDSLLLIGPHGVAKTFCAERLARTLGVRFQKVDASKAEFEEIIGFPSPKALAEGRFEVIPTPLSLVDKEFVFIDELNRAKPQVQNKLLEVVYARELMGQPTTIRWVWAAMNVGEEYTGLEALDAAFAGRFAFVLAVPDSSALTEADLAAVAGSEAAADAPALRRYWLGRGNGSGNGNGAAPDERPLVLRSLLSEAAAEYPRIEALIRDPLSALLARFVKIWDERQKQTLDGRRLAMIRRNVAATAAVRRVLKGDAIPAGEALARLAEEVLVVSLPHAALGKSVAVEAALGALRTAAAELRQDAPTLPRRLVARKVWRALTAEGTEAERLAVLQALLPRSPSVEGSAMVWALAPFAVHPRGGLPLEFRVMLLNAIGREAHVSLSFEREKTGESEAFLAWWQEQQAGDELARIALRIGVLRGDGKPAATRRAAADARAVLEELRDALRPLYEERVGRGRSGDLAFVGAASTPPAVEREPVKEEVA